MMILFINAIYIKILMRLQGILLSVVVSFTAIAAGVNSVTALQFQRVFVCLAHKMAPVDITDYTVTAGASAKTITAHLKYTGPALGGNLTVIVGRKGGYCVVTGTQ